MFHQLGPEISIITETFESEKRRLSNIFKNKTFQYISYFRKNRSPGGGCAIVFNEKRFLVTDLKISARDEIETCWALVVPRSESESNTKMGRRVAVGAYYISPRSKHKKHVIEHIIDTIHLLRARFKNEINFIIGGDFNRVDISDVLDSY